MTFRPDSPGSRPPRLRYERGTLVLEGLGEGEPPPPAGIWRWDRRTNNYRAAAWR